MFGIQGAGAELFDLVPRNQSLDFFIIVLGVDRVDLLDFMTGAETVEEVQERHGALQGRQMGDQGQVVRFLDGVAGQHRETGLAAGHNVAVIAENVQRVIRQGTGADMEDRGRQFAGDLVHIGDHQQQALGSGERGRQSAGGQGAVHSAGSTGFTLHLGDTDRLAEQVFPVMGSPLVRNFSHGG